MIKKIEELLSQPEMAKLGDRVGNFQGRYRGDDDPDPLDYFKTWEIGECIAMLGEIFDVVYDGANAAYIGKGEDRDMGWENIVEKARRMGDAEREQVRAYEDAKRETEMAHAAYVAAPLPDGPGDKPEETVYYKASNREEVLGRAVLELIYPGEEAHKPL